MLDSRHAGLRRVCSRKFRTCRSGHAGLMSTHSLGRSRTTFLITPLPYSRISRRVERRSVPHGITHLRLTRTKRPVIFVAHSLGGLILRAFLIRCKDSVLKSIHGILFFATPNLGLYEKSWAEFFTSTSRILDRKPMVKPSTLRYMWELNDKFLEFLKRQNQQAFARKVVCLYETEPVSHHGIVVSQLVAYICSAHLT